MRRARDSRSAGKSALFFARPQAPRAPGPHPWSIVVWLLAYHAVASRVSRLTSHLAPDRSCAARLARNGLRSGVGGRFVTKRNVTNGPAANRGPTPAAGACAYLKPCKWTTYHSPRHEMSDVSSKSRVRPAGSVKRRRERKTRK